MPFQGNPNAGAANPAIIQLLFAERERRARQQQEAEQAQFERMLALQKAQREERSAQISDAKALSELFTSLQGPEDRQAEQIKTARSAAPAIGTRQMLRETTGADASVAPAGRLTTEAPTDLLGVLRQIGAAPAVQGGFIGAAENQLLAPVRAQQEAQARALAPVLGVSPNAALGNVATGAENALLTQDRMAREGNRKALRKKALDERYEIRAEERKRRVAEKLAIGEELEFSDLRELSKTDTKRLEFAQDVTRDYALAERLDMGKPTDVLEIMQRWQRRVDEGAVVRESDIAIMRSVGASAIDNAFASAQSFYDNNKSFPPGFGERLRESFLGMLAEEDKKISDLYAGMEEYADGLGLTEEQKKAALPGNKRQAIKARQRIAERASRAQGAVTPELVKKLDELLAIQYGREPTDEELESALSRLGAGGP